MVLFVIRVYLLEDLLSNGVYRHVNLVNGIVGNHLLYKRINGHPDVPLTSFGCQVSEHLCTRLWSSIPERGGEVFQELESQVLDRGLGAQSHSQERHANYVSLNKDAIPMGRANTLNSKGAGGSKLISSVLVGNADMYEPEIRRHLVESASHLLEFQEHARPLRLTDTW